MENTASKGLEVAWSCVHFALLLHKALVSVCEGGSGAGAVAAQEGVLGPHVIGLSFLGYPEA